MTKNKSIKIKISLYPYKIKLLVFEKISIHVQNKIVKNYINHHIYEYYHVEERHSTKS